MQQINSSSIFRNHFLGKKVVVIGSARGIGYAIASSFAENGAQVFMADISETVETSARQLVAKGFQVTASKVDITDEGSVRELFARIKEEWGSLDFLVNNAGIIKINELENTTTEAFEQVLYVNTIGMFTACREASSLLQAGGGGAIINAASGQARQGFIYTPSYAASKFGVIGLTQSLAKELASKNIRVNAYCPGIVETDMWDYNDREWGKRLGNYKKGELMKKWIDEIPLKRAASAYDVTNLILFLCSDAGSYITGQAINIDGGMFMN
ncbi:SDR family oxidoreductase [uncultured Sphaerochaeta sp.]|uniref:SDR family NAD(P)-dependent oxidoreductase n=1 Tax=uncultured Sphaerochaeta sp. TaxID=886478 RepID=UPI002A0A1214|nr:SDR family oxidoreductase [uncultured Sphaerochaeta sp.]